MCTVVHVFQSLCMCSVVLHVWSWYSDAILQQFLVIQNSDAKLAPIISFLCWFTLQGNVTLDEHLSCIFQPYNGVV